MSRLTVFAETAPGTPILSLTDGDAIAAELKQIGVRFERWNALAPVSPQDSAETILDAYRPHLDRLMGETGAGSADVVKLTPDHPQAQALREKFLQEHTHSEDEVRFFVEGAGNFVLHLGGRIYDARCEQGDLISVPAGTRHWFDAGEKPSFTALRIFTHTDGWVANFTGDDISNRFPAVV